MERNEALTPAFFKRLAEVGKVGQKTCQDESAIKEA